jgi:aminopeptidase
MVDPRLQKLARTMVTYSVAIQPGDVVALLCDASGLPLGREIYKEVILAGGHCVTILSDGARQMIEGVLFADAEMADFYLRHANEAQLNWISPLEAWLHREADVRIIVRCSTNTRRGNSLDAKLLATRARSRKTQIDALPGRADGDEQRWTLTMFPTEAMAQEADMSLSELEDFVYKACFVDQPDPVQCWRNLEAEQQKYVDWLKGRKQVTVHGPNIEMSLSIEGRTFVNSTATHNMPSGEIFTGPVEDSVNGWVKFTYPAINGGRQVEGVELTFESGKVVKASARKNEAYLLAQLDSDPGARFLGEWAIGLNFGIDRFIGNILFDEKIGGTIHMALGRSYAITGGKNDSAIHWDMICDMRQDSEILVDGELLYKNGKFTF